MGYSELEPIKYLEQAVDNIMIINVQTALN